MMEALEVVPQRLSKELRQYAQTMSRDEARFLVDAYYNVQKARIQTGNRRFAGKARDEPAYPLLDWLTANLRPLEGFIVPALEHYADGQAVGRWAMSICGIGPVLSAGLLAEIDIEQAPTVGHIWRFAGLDPTCEWGKGEKRPWNARLKTLCWKIGESFVKVSGNEKDVYGHVWAERKALEQARSDTGESADDAAAVLERRPTHKQRATYAEGKLPQGHIHARAKRYAVKLFLAHWHHVAYESINGEPPPKPYVLEHGGHSHFIAPPGYDATQTRVNGPGRDARGE